jgi:hypothetical protein
MSALGRSVMVCLLVLGWSPLTQASMVCDAMSVCLEDDQGLRYRQAEAHIAIENWGAAIVILEAIYTETLATGSPMSLLVANNYAVALARTGQPAVAALVLERYFRRQETFGPGFTNLMRTYDHLSVNDTAGELLLQTMQPAIPPDPAYAVAPPMPTPETVQPDESELTERVDAFLASWSSGNIANYRSFYLPGRSPKRYVTYQDWLENRRARVTPDRDIRVSRKGIVFQELAADLISTEFQQTYIARNYSEVSQKRIIWRLTEGVWRIEQEESF